MDDQLTVPSVEEMQALLEGTAPDPYTGEGWDFVQDYEATQETMPQGFASLVSAPKLAGNSTKEATAWLNLQRSTGANWYRMCLALQRTAREIPPLAASAYAASLLTPSKEKVHKVANLRRGMIGFSKGSDPAGHVFEILGRRPGFDESDPNGVLTLSNDVVSGKTGHVGIVTLSFYTVHWGHKFQFGATWLNGYDFADFNAKPKPVHPTLGVNYEHSIKLLKKALRAHESDKDRYTYKLIRDDIERMSHKYNKLKAQHHN
jgi:hypothetical protein